MMRSCSHEKYFVTLYTKTFRINKHGKGKSDYKSMGKQHASSLKFTHTQTHTHKSSEQRR